MTPEELNRKLSGLSVAHRDRISQINRRFLIGVWIIITARMLVLLAPLIMWLGGYFVRMIR